jgi:hypothetical protein
MTEDCVFGVCGRLHRAASEGDEAEWVAAMVAAGSNPVKVECIYE